MIAVVNNQYKYVFLYSGKAGCTSLRQLYLALHKEEMTAAEVDSLDWYHNLNEVHPYDPQQDYSDYFTFIITRNPYTRIVSAFLDQYVYSRSAQVEQMFSQGSGNTRANIGARADSPDNFLDFLTVLANVPDELRDTHFQTQSYFPYASMVVTTASPRFRWLGQKPPHAFGVNYMGDISGFGAHMQKIVKRIFKGNKPKLSSALTQIERIKKSNSSFYGTVDYADAAQLSVDELDTLVFAPKPQDFLRSSDVVDLIERIYRQDFELFGYTLGDWPSKSASSEIDQVPNDMDWEMYIRLNPDLPRDQIYNERGVVRHYLEFGRYEEHPRAYKIEAPDGFDWQRYLSLNSDLRAQGIDNANAAIEHYISYGIRQHRPI